MSKENLTKIIESAWNKKPADAQKAFNIEIMERITSAMPAYLQGLNESAFGPEDDEDDDLSDLDFDELSDEDFADLLDNLSDEELEDLADQIDGLDESELQELSKERVASYVSKAVGDRHKADTAYSDATSRRNKAHGTYHSVKKAGPDSDYGETDDNHAGRLKNIAKRFEKAKSDESSARKRSEKRSTGIFNAGKRLAKEEVQIDEISTAKKADYAAKAVMHISDVKSNMQKRMARHGVETAGSKEEGDKAKILQRQKILKKVIGKRTV